MPTTATFGRRADPQTSSYAATPARRVPPAAPDTLAMPEPIAPTDFADTMAMVSLADELREWKQSRTSGFEMPWKQISLMASLCFGIASFVLPDGTNAIVNWILYALMAVSFVVGISRRRRKRAETTAPG